MPERLLIVRGVPDATTGESLDLGPLVDVFSTTPRYREGVRFEAAARGESVQDHAIAYRDSDVVEVRYANGVRRYMRADRLAEDFAVAPARGAAARVVRADAFETATARGVVKHTVEGLRLIGIDLPDLAGRKLADFVADKVEGAIGRAPGVYRVTHVTGHARGAADTDGPQLQAVDPGEIPADRPVLVFLHGTGSSFGGSFGDLWRAGADEGGQRPADTQTARWGLERLARWQRFVADNYGPHVYALEHRTLSQSPMANALALLEVLPRDARLHLVSHSRGGLVGELLARAVVADGVADAEPFTAAERARFENDSRPGRRAQLAELDALASALIDRRPRVERFVRVACPARGTTLADGKLDDWLSGFTSLVERFTPIAESDLFYLLKTVLLASVKQKADPSVLPGIEAMMTDSPVIGLINGGPRVAADLSVIAGDTDATGWIPWMWPVDRFFASEHFPEGRNDLVVPTRSMELGYRRGDGNARRFEVSGSDINHFRYFAHRETFDRLIAALARGDGEQAGFVPMRRGGEVPRRRRAAAIQGPTPRVLIIPGISGSHIKVRNERIWMALHELLLGNITDLDVNGVGDPDHAETGADGIIQRSYGDLTDFLSATHQVIEFGFDWRRPLSESARILDAWITTALDDPAHAGQPVRILAHSMGGLLMRVWKARHEHTWARLAQHAEARVLMLGTPSRGSFSIPHLLLGRDELIGYLSLVDPFHGPGDLLDLFRRFPGILALLPQDHDQLDFTKVETWRRLRRADRGDWPLPERADLAGLQAEWAALADDVSIDADRMIYVAGRAETTLVDMQVTDSGSSREVAFIGTLRGDGRVPWEGGIPSPLKDANRVWYMNAVHGDLCRHEPAFLALQELLQDGETTRLPRVEPAVRGARAGEDERFEVPDDRVVLFPDEDMILDAVLGARRTQRPALAPELDIPVVRVGVTHGDLHHESARPIVVGHYAGDAIISAERALDRKLEGRLMEIQRLGIYPGAVGQSEVVLVGGTGAVVVGLGEAGDLTPRILKHALRDGLLRFARTRVEADRSVGGDAAPTDYGLSVAMLLVGSGSVAVSVTESVQSALEAITAANEALATQALPVRISDLEFLELFEDLAITAAKTLRSLSAMVRWQTRFAFEAKVHEGRGGWRRGNFHDSPDWWRRIQVLAMEDGSLRYNTSTDRARVEVHVQSTQRTLLDSFVRDATQLTARDPKVEQALFELLLPNRLKDHASDERAVMLMLDAQTARYPWEMLNDFRAPGLGDDSGLPLAARQRMLRRFMSDEFRERPVTSLEPAALVIGNPATEFPDLPGAEEEARDVMSRLTTAGFAVTSQLGREASPTEVIKSLFSGSYRALHLAGHGVYRYAVDSTDDGDTTEVSGMVLGDGVFLTAVEIEQMRVVPELVFINCCSLGRIEPAERQGRQALVAGRSVLAANLATQFMKMGAVAVVAAGWEVEDAAAQCFANTFYDHMLAGESFGDAVLEARRRVFRDHSATNTWGAYQCYGNPSYELRSGGGARSSGGAEPAYVSPREAEIQLWNVASSAQKGIDDAYRTWLINRLDEIRERCAESWIRGNPQVQEAFANAYSQLGDFGSAIAWYTRAIEHVRVDSDRDYPGRVFDQWLNLRVREAVAGDTARSAAGAASEIRRCIAHLKRLAAVQPTVERQALLGSAYKRLALTEGLRARDVSNALKQCAEAYLAAARLSAKADGRYDPYPGINGLMAAALARWRRVPVAVRSGVLAPDELAGALREQLSDQVPGNVWERSYACDLAFFESIRDDALDANRTQLARGYRSLRTYCSAREFDSVLAQLEFVAKMAPRSQRESVLSLLKAIGGDGDDTRG